MNSLEINANAKINLALAVKYKRDDSYHELDLIFQEINFSDHLLLSKDHRMLFSSDSQELINESDNICIKAARLLQRDFDIPGINIHLEKKIPVGGGLGGGSSDAAAVLKGGKCLYDLTISDEHLLSLASELGADVPFFLLGKAAYGKGKGEILTPINIYNDYYILLVLPEIRISTIRAYKNLNLALTSKYADYKFRGFRFQNMDLSEFRTEFYNDFENSVFKAHPLLGELKSRLYNEGASFAAMSGSGAVIFGLFDREETRAHAFESMNKNYHCVKVEPIC